ncbi:MAG TPA: glycosyltransferase family 39 protein [Polyangiaceae bacterium]|nr:glycosyltransferase family 39 protein [Polyangiaceae bacterium]
MTDTPATAKAARLWARSVDPLIFWALFGGYLAALLATAHTLGYARDEGFYFHAAGTYGRWFDQLFSNPGRALSQSVVDRFWQENREHPALMKSLFALSQRFLEGVWFSERGTAERFPAMLISALGVATTFAFGRRCVGRAAGVVAALAFGLMPQVFYHSHLACFDMPIAAFWLFVAYAFYRSTEPRGWPWAIACAVLYGLALETKHNAWYLPPALISYAVFIALPGLLRRFRARGRTDVPRERFWRRLGRGFLRGPLALVLMVLIGPAIFYALWPWIWSDTWPRLVAYFEFHWHHVYYNMEFLGRTYFEPPFPITYAPLMTLATVPLITLVLALCGAVAALVQIARGVRAEASTTPAPETHSPWSHAVLWAACLVLSYAPWLLPTTPIFGGTKHWLNAYPFLALFAGQGFALLVRLLREQLPASKRAWRVAAPFVLGACAMLGPLVMTWHSHPWGLTAYTPLVGGAPGAATLGLNRTFWGYTTGSVTGFLNEKSPRGVRVFLHDTAYDSFKMLQKDGRLRSDLKPWGTVSGSSVALYHHEQHMSRVEHMIWVDYGTTTPAHIATFDGVPIVWVYQRPSAASAAPAAQPPPSEPPAAPPPDDQPPM